MSNPASETLRGSYNVITMPDGSQQLVEKLSDGSWAFVNDRLKQQEEFNARFNDTTTVPNDWKPATEIQSLIKSKAISTKQHLMAHLIEVLGCPTEIIKNGLDPAKKAYLHKMGAERATLLIIIKSINDPKWNEAAHAI